MGTAKYVILLQQPDQITRSRTSTYVAELESKHAAELARNPTVKAVAPVMPMKLIAAFHGDDTSPHKDVSPSWGITEVSADTSPFTGDGVCIAILDTGIDAGHPAFRGVEFIRRNFTSAGSDDDTDDENGHGTHCAATTFGRDVDGRRVGVAPGVKKAMIAKVVDELGSGSDRVVRAILWALDEGDEGAKVISMSLGIDFPGYVNTLVAEGVPMVAATSIALEGYRANIRLFQDLASFLRAREPFGRSALLVAAAGNESRRNGSPAFEVATCLPAAADGIVSVAALAKRADGGLIVADFSNVGARVAAPGVDIMSADYGGGLVAMSGTSMATPHVAGVAALWAQKLVASNEFSVGKLCSMVLGRTKRVPGASIRDVGDGLVQAPQEN